MKKKILIILLIIILLAGGSAWYYWNSLGTNTAENIKVPDSSNIMAAIEKAEKENATKGDAAKDSINNTPGADTAAQANNAGTSQSNDNTASNAGKTESSAGNTASSSQNASSNKGNDTSTAYVEKQIVNKYTAGFNELKSESLASLNSLIKQAQSEYNSVPDDKKASAKVSIGLKYLKLGKSLESQCDSIFNSLLDKMKGELKANNLPTDSADTAQKQYNAEKSERRDYIMSKAF